MSTEVTGDDIEKRFSRVDFEKLSLQSPNTMAPWYSFENCPLARVFVVVVVVVTIGINQTYSPIMLVPRAQ
jgi:hypothetical protein